MKLKIIIEWPSEWLVAPFGSPQSAVTTPPYSSMHSPAYTEGLTLFFQTQFASQTTQLLSNFELLLIENELLFRFFHSICYFAVIVDLSDRFVAAIAWPDGRFVQHRERTTAVMK